METLASMLEKTLKRQGFYVFTIRDYMSRVRGGHNFIQIRFGGRSFRSHRNGLDMIVALNEETASLHRDRLNGNGAIICDEELNGADERMVRLPLKTIAKAAGNIRTAGTAALGAVLGLLGLDLSGLEAIIEEQFRPEIAAQNITALRQGNERVNKSFACDRPGGDDRLLINGNEAIALGALAAGLKFYSAYPMTPSTSIMDYLAAKMERTNVVVEQAEDEIAAINMAIGASYTGARAMTGTSGGGFCLMAEGLGLAGMQEIPLVVADIQRPGPVTGFPTRTEQGDLGFVTHASHGEFPKMVIALKSPEDAFYQTVRAFNLADKYQMPVILLGDQFLADSTVTITPFDFERVQINRFIDNTGNRDGKEYRRYEITETGVSPRILPGKIPGQTVLADSDEHDERGRITESAEMRIKMNDKRLRKLEYLSKELQEPDYLGEPSPEVLLVAWGSTCGPLSEALKALNGDGGKKYGALVFGDLWPLPSKLLMEKAAPADEIINVEQNATGQLASLIMEHTGIKCTGSVLKYDGRPLSGEEIYNKLKSR